jgi:hypothetical protein
MHNIRPEEGGGGGLRALAALDPGSAARGRGGGRAVLQSWVPLPLGAFCSPERKTACVSFNQSLPSGLRERLSWAHERELLLQFSA